MPQFNVALRQFRISQGQTQGELGRLLGVPQSTISKWEKGAQQPDAEHAARLARVMGISVKVLFGFEQMEQADIGGFSETMQSEFEHKSQQAQPHEAGSKPGHHPAWGAMKGTFKLLPGVDLTEPADPEWGKVYDLDHPLKLHE